MRSEFCCASAGAYQRSGWSPTAGNYRLLPSVIEDELARPGQRLQRPGEVLETQLAEQQRDALRRVDFLLRSKLLAVSGAGTRPA